MRYIFGRTVEKYNLDVSFHPKPIEGSWNGSSCHVNFSIRKMEKKMGMI